MPMPLKFCFSHEQYVESIQSMVYGYTKIFEKVSFLKDIRLQFPLFIFYIKSILYVKIMQYWCSVCMHSRPTTEVKYL